MTIYDDINNANTVEELSTLWQTEFANFQSLRTAFNQKSQERNQLRLLSVPRLVCKIVIVTITLVSVSL